MLDEVRFGAIKSSQNNDGTLSQKLRPVTWHPERFLDRMGVGDKGRSLAEVGGDVLVVTYDDEVK